MRTRNALAALAAGALLVGSAGAAQAYTLNSDGTGWVGKGEVQTVAGLNNAGIQALHTGVTFTYESSVRYAQDCEKEAGQSHNTVEQTFRKSVAVNATISSGSRQTGQWTGWFLTGYGSSNGGGAPTDLCTPGGGQGEENNGWYSVSDVYVVEGSETGGLYAHVPGKGSFLLP